MFRTINDYIDFDDDDPEMVERRERAEAVGQVGKALLFEALSFLLLIVLGFFMLMIVPSLALVLIFAPPIIFGLFTLCSISIMSIFGAHYTWPFFAVNLGCSILSVFLFAISFTNYGL